jgi:transposase
MTGNIDRIEVITSVQRRRRWSAEEKARIVQETYAPGMSVSLVARQHGVAPNQVFKWRQLYVEVRCRRSEPVKRWCPPPNTGCCWFWGY